MGNCSLNTGWTQISTVETLKPFAYLDTILLGGVLTHPIVKVQLAAWWVLEAYIGWNFANKMMWPYFRGYYPGW